MKTAIDCVVGAWTKGDCDQATKKRKYTRIVTTPATNGGKTCPTLIEMRDDTTCTTISPLAVVDCVVGAWIKGECDPTTKKRKYTRVVTTPAKNGGKVCPPLIELQDDTTCAVNQLAPVDCAVGTWAKGECDPTTKKRKYTRVVTTPAKNGGKVCPPLIELRDDATCTAVNPLAAVDCVVGAWTQGACDPSTKQRKYTRVVTTPAKNGGKVCPSLVELRDDATCAVPGGVGIGVGVGIGIGNSSIPQHCIVSEWVKGECDASTKRRIYTREVTQMAKNQGRGCPPLIELRDDTDCAQVPETDMTIYSIISLILYLLFNGLIISIILLFIYKKL